MSADAAHADDVAAGGRMGVRVRPRRPAARPSSSTRTAHPLAVGEIRASTAPSDAPTVLLYGHFDVQPPAPLDLWESDPFEPEIRDGYLYARGVVDDKGNSYLVLKAAPSCSRRRARCPVNVRVAFDGEEEIGGHSIVDFLAADERGADACIIFDSGMPREDMPAFDLGTRGLVYFHVSLATGERDLHSGMFGGAALNAVHALMQALEARRSAAARASCAPGSCPPTEEEMRLLARARRPGADVLADAGATPMDAAGGRGLLPAHAGRARPWT